MSTCAGCATPLPPHSGRGRPRKWCDACRDRPPLIDPFAGRPTRCQREGCRNLLDQRGSNRPRLWCSGACRKAERYSGTCIDCGARTDGTASGKKPVERCRPCATLQQTEQRVWTDDKILASFHRWRDLTGRFPNSSDWNPAQVKNAERRALLRRLRAATGPWPHVWIVQRRFGSFNAAVVAAGGEPVPPHSRGPRVRHADLRTRLREIVEAVAA